MKSPHGVPGPVCVMRSFSSLVSIAQFYEGAAARLKKCQGRGAPERKSFCDDESMAEPNKDRVDYRPPPASSARDPRPVILMETTRGRDPLGVLLRVLGAFALLLVVALLALLVLF